MLTHQERYACPPFIHYAEKGHFVPYPHLRYCLVKYDITYYHDMLFTQYAIPAIAEIGQVAVKRRAEYLAARYAAQQLLRVWGCCDNVGSASDGAPIWPTGFCGSLSHSSEYAIAVIAPSAGVKIPGVDIEAFSPPGIKEIADVFTTSEERQYLLSIDEVDIESALLIAFSAKESLYKSLYPDIGVFLDFDAAFLCELDVEKKMFILILTRTLSPDYLAGRVISGHYDIVRRNVITVIG